MSLKEKLKRNNLHLKLLSIAVAIIFWSFVMGIVNPDISSNYRNIEVRVNGIQNIESNGMAYIAPENPTVNVRISGPRSEINEITNDNVQASIDISHLQVGESRVPVVVSIRNFYGVVNIEDIEPAYIEVFIDSVESKTLDIDVKINGNLSEGYVLGDVNPVVDQVTIKGPSSQLENIVKAEATVDVSQNRTETFVVSSEIDFYDRDGEIVEDVESDINVVDIEVPITKAKSVPVEVSFTGNLPENQIIENVKVEPENVVIIGSQEVLDDVESIETEDIDYGSLNDQNSIEVGLVLPDGVKLIDETTTVKVNFQLTDSISKMINIPTDDIEIRNTNEEYTYEIINDEEISVELYGENSTVAGITSEDIDLFIDVNNLTPGQYQLYIKHENDSIRQLEPNNVTINIGEKQ